MTDKQTPRRTIARALAEADREKDAVIAKRYGVHVRTLWSWRQRARDDLELASMVDKARRLVVESWRPEAASTLVALLAELRRLAREGKDIPFALIGATKTAGAMCVEAGALLGHPDPDVDPWESAAPMQTSDTSAGH